MFANVTFLYSLAKFLSQNSNDGFYVHIKNYLKFTRNMVQVKSIVLSKVHESNKSYDEINETIKVG